MEKTWRFQSGEKNLISDVAGVTVGHVTYAKGDIQTGVTAIKAHPGNHFQEKLVAASHVMNGFGKSVGLVQIDELGQLETPIILTNTLAVGTCVQGLVSYMLSENDDIGVSTGTVNSVVCECNDGYLNAIRRRTIREEDVFIALERTTVDFERGAVGAGRGMSCYELKGGIGSSSRIFELDGQVYTIGVLVLSNFGRLPDLTIRGQDVGAAIQATSEHEDKGSIIVIVATDLPVDSRQLQRIIKRSAVGIARTGSYIGNGSGEIVVGFSTAQKLPHYSEKAILNRCSLHEDKLEQAFAATAEATEAAILDSLFASETVQGCAGHERKSITTYLKAADFNI